MRTLEHPATGELSLDAVLAALADPVRRTIVAQLAAGHEDQACLAFDLPVSKSTSTHHFRVLREAGVIRQRRPGRRPGCRPGGGVGRLIRPCCRRRAGAAAPAQRAIPADPLRNVGRLR